MYISFTYAKNVQCTFISFTFIYLCVHLYQCTMYIISLTYATQFLLFLFVAHEGEETPQSNLQDAGYLTN